MGLADLKKRATPSEALAATAPSVNVDDFINDALHYAMGQPPQHDNIVNFHRLEQRLAERNATLHPLKRGTFTLGDDTIDKLRQLAQESDISRSRMVRFLVNYFEQLNPQQRKLLYRQFMID
ncbi:CopG family transcriptional regulator [Shewanella sp.]|uniref:ribbon-helix-helix domain-containing protein n=1 Tax=Shewanella sp. TaxID=50422 RepID=UPI003A96ED3E